MAWRWSLIGVLLAQPAWGQVVITEIMPNPTTLNDEAEWIELQNLGAGGVSLDGWSINDFTGASVSSESTTRWTFPAGTYLSPQQVIIVANYASGPGVLEEFGVRADFELAALRDDPTVPNLLPVGGTQSIALNNSVDGDGLLLRDNFGNIVDGAEWGLDKLVNGLPALQPSQGQSLLRLQVSGSSQVDFTVTAVPNPGVGIGTGPAPSLARPRRSAFAIWGQPFTVGVESGANEAQAWFASSASNVGASNSYGGRTMLLGATGFEVTVNLGSDLPRSNNPATFSEQYVRWYYEARSGGVATLPANANAQGSNTAFYWDNVLPSQAVTSLAVARAQDSAGAPTWMHHAVRVEGIALTYRSAFRSMNTDFFIASDSGEDAIHVFDFGVVAAAMRPGDRVRVIGRVGIHRGLRQIGTDQRMGQPFAGEPQTIVEVIGTGQIPVRNLNLAELLRDPERYESQLVQISNVRLVSDPTTGAPPPSVWSAESPHWVNDGTGNFVVWVATGVSLVGNPAPGGTFTLRAIVSQYTETGVGGHQLLPRDVSDVIVGAPTDAGFVDFGGQVPDSGGLDGGGVDATNFDAATFFDAGNGVRDAGVGDAAWRPIGSNRDDGRGGCNANGPNLPVWLLLPFFWRFCHGRGRRGF